MNLENTTLESVLNAAVPGAIPHPWQTELAKYEMPNNRLIRIPTGMGKTLAVLCVWILHRVLRNQQSWPTRLVWCLPMRTLVEQTVQEALKLLASLELAERVKVHTLMGGVDPTPWYDSPEQPAILIGTQDMLLSRSLNRGYAMGRAAWPRAFGLLNSDSLWVMDEIQLMGVGLTTSAQIQSFFDADLLQDPKPEKPRLTWWMSATLQSDWLSTPEMLPHLDELKENQMSVAARDRVGPQWSAKKPVERKVEKLSDWPNLVLQRHLDHQPDSRTGRQTLVVVNTVKQARELHGGLIKATKKLSVEVETRLIHSRFRPADREAWLSNFLSRETLGPDINRIMIATQVVEAGVDISASCLITELAPWPSLVQRFGRAARYGGSATIVVLDQMHTDEGKALPYAIEELEAARDAIDRVGDVSIGSLEDFEASLTPAEVKSLYPFQPLHVLVRDEFEELFDTSPDLSGADMDISRFIREDSENRDVQVFWRSWEFDRPEQSLQPDRRELCSVPIGEADAWIKKLRKRSTAVWSWNYLDGEWTRLDASGLRPGLVLLVSPETGGYDPDLGFTGNNPKKNELVPVVEDVIRSTEELSDLSDGNDDQSAVDVWKTIATHSREAQCLGSEVCDTLGLSADLCALVSLTLRLHDWGKAHIAFAEGTYQVAPVRTDLAKAPECSWRAKQRLYNTPSYGPRRGFRHELVSCLATLELLRGAEPSHPAILGRISGMLTKCGMNPDLEPASWDDHPVAAELRQLSAIEFNLVLFLIASHHGKVRASLQASPLDQEFPIESKFIGVGFPIRGVREGDKLPLVLLPTTTDKNTEMPELTISLAVASMGLSQRYGASWSERMDSLLSHYGPFTLSYLESVIRSIDCRASDDTQPPGSAPDPLLEGIKLAVPKKQTNQSPVLESGEVKHV